MFCSLWGKFHMCIKSSQHIPLSWQVHYYLPMNDIDVLHYVHVITMASPVVCSPGYQEWIVPVICCVIKVIAHIHYSCCHCVKNCQSICTYTAKDRFITIPIHLYLTLKESRRRRVLCIIICITTFSLQSDSITRDSILEAVLLVCPLLHTWVVIWTCTSNHYHVCQVNRFYVCVVKHYSWL